MTWFFYINYRKLVSGSETKRHQRSIIRPRYIHERSGTMTSNLTLVEALESLESNVDKHDLLDHAPLLHEDIYIIFLPLLTIFIGKNL